MAAIRTLDARTALPTLLVEICYTLSRLRAHPLGAPYVAMFEGLRAQYTQTYTEDVELLEGQADAQAVVDVADEDLNDLADRFSRTLLTITKSDRGHPLYRYYFPDKDLAGLKRPVLGSQLTAMTAWVSPAQASEHPAIQAMAPELAAAVAAGAQAEKNKKEAARLRREFRDLGGRREFVDALNAARKEAHGGLAKLPHTQTGLPANFADRFFRRDPGRPEVDEEEETSETVRARIEELHTAIAAAEERLAELLAEEEVEARAAQARAAQEAKVAELDRAMAELQAKRASLVASLHAG